MTQPYHNQTGFADYEFSPPICPISRRQARLFYTVYVTYELGLSTIKFAGAEKPQLSYTYEQVTAKLEEYPVDKEIEAKCKQLVKTAYQNLAEYDYNSLAPRVSRNIQRPETVKTWQDYCLQSAKITNQAQELLQQLQRTPTPEPTTRKRNTTTMPPKKTRSSSRKDKEKSSTTPAKNTNEETTTPAATPSKPKKVRVVTPEQTQEDPFVDTDKTHVSAEEDSDNKDISAATQAKTSRKTPEKVSNKTAQTNPAATKTSMIEITSDEESTYSFSDEGEELAAESDQAKDEGKEYPLTVQNYGHRMGQIVTRQVDNEMPYWKVRFNRSQKKGGEESLDVMTLDYVMAGFRDVKNPEQSSHPLAEEYCKVEDKLKEVWDEIMDAKESKATTERKEYVSESAFIRRVKRQVDAAVKTYIRNRAEYAYNKRNTKDHNNQLPAKVDILALRYIDPCSFNGQIAAKLAFLGRVDLMIIGNMPEAEARTTFVQEMYFKRFEEDLRRKVEKSDYEMVNRHNDKVTTKFEERIAALEETNAELNLKNAAMETSIAALQLRLNVLEETVTKQKAAATQPKSPVLPEENEETELELDEVHPTPSKKPTSRGRTKQAAETPSKKTPAKPTVTKPATNPKTPAKRGAEAISGGSADRWGKRRNLEV
ncbi:unnamed protein product [Clonostachys rosea f. rosea IK726]|uniref:Uncharacterized protein n=1 Tax=Clonostachys rosea f. rosea IK726 TaxID=1349383 RepID=A0ACA9UJP1_BIOOC|nr:unnamed protein product [Clonostachys rosea f. rosea IK726]